MGLNTKILENIRKVEPYVPGEQPQHKVIKLNTNENPYPPAPGVERALRDMDTDRLRLYPDPSVEELVSALAEHYQVGKDQVFVGVGSDDVLSMCFMTFFNSESRSYFRISRILFIKYGQNCTGFLMNVRNWMENFGL